MCMTVCKRKQYFFNNYFEYKVVLSLNIFEIMSSASLDKHDSYLKICIYVYYFSWGEICSLRLN